MENQSQVSERMIGAGLEVFYLMTGRPARSVVEQIYLAMQAEKQREESADNKVGGENALR